MELARDLLFDQIQLGGNVLGQRVDGVTGDEHSAFDVLVDLRPFFGS